VSRGQWKPDGMKKSVHLGVFLLNGVGETQTQRYVMSDKLGWHRENFAPWG